MDFWDAHIFCLCQVGYFCKYYAVKWDTFVGTVQLSPLVYDAVSWLIFSLADLTKDENKTLKSSMALSWDSLLCQLMFVL